MNTKNRSRLLGNVVICVLLAGSVGCGGSVSPEPARIATYPVTGEITVEGQPAEDLEVTCHEVKSLGTGAAFKMTANTDRLGKFQLSTYAPGDGVPEGEYVLTFLWGKLNVLSTRYEGPDRLNNRYLDPNGAKTKFTSTKGKRVDLGKIELTTK